MGPPVAKLLNLEVVGIGKSILAFNQEMMTSLSRKAKARRVVLLSRKVSLGSTLFPYRKPTQVRRWKSTKASG